MTTNQFTRIGALIGEDGLSALRDSFVIIAGMGAVGSYVTEALARAGVGKLRVIDFDIIQESNLNRQLFALHSTLGSDKVEIAKQRIIDINPSCLVDGRKAFLGADSVKELLEGEPTVVIDAIDSVNPKTDLLEYTRNNNIFTLSSMGSARRLDPSLIRIGILEEVHHCPLARYMRNRLRRRKVPLDIRCVYSIEHDHPHAVLPLPKSDSADVNTLNRGRQRQPMGSLPTITGIFGLILAHETIRYIAKINY